MLGKQNSRAGSFSMLHASALVLALGLAAFISPAIETRDAASDLKLSEYSATSLTDPYVVIRAKMVRFLECDEAKSDINA